jgi:copper resistance protein B
MIAVLLALALQTAPVPADDPKGTDQSPGSAPAPAIAHTSPADAIYDPAAMMAARHAMMTEYDTTTSAFRLDLAEVQMNRNGGGYRWEGEGWIGKTDRFVLRARGEGNWNGGDQSELQALYSHAVSPWWNLQAGVRQDITPAGRTHAMVGVEGMAPYRIAITAAAFLSQKGEFSARIEAVADQRLTRRIAVEPRVELNLSAQNTPAQRQGAGLTSAEAGLRLRYDLSRNLAPYVGVSWTWLGAQTAAYGQSGAARSVVVGLRGWF